MPLKFNRGNVEVASLACLASTMSKGLRCVSVLGVGPNS